MANQWMLHPALLTFMWEAVKGKKGKKLRYGRRGTNKRNGSSEKIAVEDSRNGQY